jgi:alpha-tubulin suppressor-like RCC1 family protein
MNRRKSRENHHPSHF